MSGLTEEFIHRKSSQEITSLLYEAAIHNINEAIAAIQMKDYMEANRNLQKTNDILYRLGAGLNYEAGIISDQLDALYNYLAEQVIEANLKNKLNP
ncbi:flagellar export chaperone FliS [Thalassobacillus sp. C254]|uniref:flagellar export chaperone FliS n=1 Tax=Thalassobacillus sp. C254 TaxID=1225341 RepID=UPI000AC67585|nr:flagellar protein FliS [Thalassobacillus sp. C254]